jgi:uncharacterized membrane protein YhaH (DUF805 family)
MHLILLPYRRFFDFSGRSRRLEFWLFTLINLAITIAFVWLTIELAPDELYDILAKDEQSPAELDRIGYLFFQDPVIFTLIVVYTTYSLFILIPSIAVAVRRLHDSNLTGWLYLGFALLSVVPILGLLAPIAFFIVMLLPGSSGANAYGEDPRSRGYDYAFA